MTFQFYSHFQVYHHLAQNEKSSVGTPQPHIVSNMALLHCIKHSTPLIHFPFTAATLYLSVPLLFGPRPLFGPMGILSQVIIHHYDSFLSVQDKDSC